MTQTISLSLVLLIVNKDLIMHIAIISTIEFKGIVVGVSKLVIKA